MAYSHWTGTGPGQVQGIYQELCIVQNVFLILRLGREPGSIVSYCPGPVPCTRPSPIPLQCEQAIIFILLE